MSRFDVEDYMGNLGIDKHALDEECMIQPILYEHWSSKFAKAISARDKYKHELELVKAKLEAEISAKASKGGKRITNKIIEAKVMADKKFIKANERFLKYKARANKLQAIKESFAQKKDMLKVMTDLFISNYFSEVKSSDVRDMEKKGVKKGLEKLRDKRKKKKKKKIRKEIKT